MHEWEHFGLASNYIVLFFLIYRTIFNPRLTRRRGSATAPLLSFFIRIFVCALIITVFTDFFLNIVSHVFLKKKICSYPQRPWRGGFRVDNINCCKKKTANIGSNFSCEKISLKDLIISYITVFSKIAIFGCF